MCYRWRKIARGLQSKNKEYCRFRLLMPNFGQHIIQQMIRPRRGSTSTCCISKRRKSFWKLNEISKNRIFLKMSFQNIVRKINLAKETWQCNNHKDTTTFQSKKGTDRKLDFYNMPIMSQQSITWKEVLQFFEYRKWDERCSLRNSGKFGVWIISLTKN